MQFEYEDRFFISHVSFAPSPFGVNVLGITILPGVTIGAAGFTVIVKVSGLPAQPESFEIKLPIEIAYNRHLPLH